MGQVYIQFCKCQRILTIAEMKEGICIKCKEKKEKEPQQVEHNEKQK